MTIPIDQYGRLTDSSTAAVSALPNIVHHSNPILILDYLHRVSLLKGVTVCVVERHDELLQLLVILQGSDY